MAVIIHFPVDGRMADRRAPREQPAQVVAMSVARDQPAQVVALSVAREQRAKKRHRVMELLRAEHLRAACATGTSTASLLTKESEPSSPLRHA
jgi:hypothetical protein